MSKERILLSQDNDLKSRILSDLPKFKKTFEPVKDAFAQLQIGSLTNDIFSTIIEGKAESLRAGYFQSIEDQLKKDGVTNSVLKKIAMEGTAELFNAFLIAAKGFINTDLTPSPYGIGKDRVEFLELSDLSYSIKDGLSISEFQEEVITEKHCRLYAETEMELEIYHAAKQLAPALQNFLTVLKNTGIPFYEFEFGDGRKGFSSNSYIENFFTCDKNMEVNIIPGVIPWPARYKAEAEKARERELARYQKVIGRK